MEIKTVISAILNGDNTDKLMAVLSLSSIKLRDFPVIDSTELSQLHSALEIFCRTFSCVKKIVYTSSNDTNIHTTIPTIPFYQCVGSQYYNLKDYIRSLCIRIHARYKYMVDEGNYIL